MQQQIELTLSLTKRDLKARYKDSLLGFFWSLFRPAFLTLIIWVVFAKIVPIRFDHPTVPYWLHVLVSILTWNFFIGSVSDATQSVVVNANLLKKVRLDSEVFPIASIASHALHLVLASTIVVPLLFLSGVGIHWNFLLLPVVLIILTILVLGIAFYLSALNVFYRDVGGALELLSMAWFYVTPIIYPVKIAHEAIGSKLGSGWFVLYMLNPVAPLVVAIRRTVLYGHESGELPDTTLLLFVAISAALSLLLLITGWLLFRRLSVRFADEL